MEHMKVSRSNAAHQPSLNRIMISPPYWSRAINSSGTPVSEMIITSRRQQHALQFEQDTFEEDGDLVGIIMNRYNLVNWV